MNTDNDALMETIFTEIAYSLQCEVNGEKFGHPGRVESVMAAVDQAQKAEATVYKISDAHYAHLISAAALLVRAAIVYRELAHKAPDWKMAEH